MYLVISTKQTHKDDSTDEAADDDDDDDDVGQL